MMNGPSHENGGIPIEVEGGEFIIRKEAVDFWGKDVFQHMNTNYQKYDSGAFVEPTTKSTNRGASISTDDIPGVKDIVRWAFGDEKHISAGFELWPPSAWLEQNIFREGGYAKFANGTKDSVSEDMKGVLDQMTKTDEKFYGLDINVGTDWLGYAKGKFGLEMPGVKPIMNASYEPPEFVNNIVDGVKSIFNMEQGGYTSDMFTFRSGGSVDPMVSILLAELVDLQRERSDTEVNVYTDLSGQTRAAVDSYNAEIRERDLRDRARAST